MRRAARSRPRRRRSSGARAPSSTPRERRAPERARRRSVGSHTELADDKAAESPSLARTPSSRSRGSASEPRARPGGQEQLAPLLETLLSRLEKRLAAAAEGRHDALGRVPHRARDCRGRRVPAAAGSGGGGERGARAHRGTRRERDLARARLPDRLHALRGAERLQSPRRVSLPGVARQRAAPARGARGAARRRRGAGAHHDAYRHAARAPRLCGHSTPSRTRSTRESSDSSRSPGVRPVCIRRSPRSTTSALRRRSTSRQPDHILDVAKVDREGPPPRGAMRAHAPDYLRRAGWSRSLRARLSRSCVTGFHRAHVAPRATRGHGAGGRAAVAPARGRPRRTDHARRGDLARRAPTGAKAALHETRADAFAEFDAAMNKLTEARDLDAFHSSIYRVSPRLRRRARDERSRAGDARAARVGPHRVDDGSPTWTSRSRARSPSR